MREKSLQLKFLSVEKVCNLKFLCVEKFTTMCHPKVSSSKKIFLRSQGP